MNPQPEEFCQPPAACCQRRPSDGARAPGRWVPGAWDAVVVGAGPAGCTTAALLAGEGLRVLLLDKSPSPPPKVCGEFLSPGCLRILERIGALRAVLAAGARPLFGMRIHTPAGRTLQATYPREAGCRAAHGLAIPRSLLDPILLDVALKRGAEFAPNFQVSDLVWDADRVVGVRGRLHGRARTLSARLVVGADGRNSVVARRLGPVDRHDWLDKIALVGYVGGAMRAEDVGEVFLGRDRYCILNPIGPDLTNVGLVINRSDFQRGVEPARLLMGAGQTLRGLRDRLAPCRPAGPVRCLGPLAHRARRLAVPGAMLVGDAAGFLDPFTGEGIHAGLRGAELAARIALETFGRDAASCPDPDAYARAWATEFLPKWRLCLGLQHAIRHPALAEWIVSRLEPRPNLATLVMTAVGDLLPARDLGLVGLLRRLVAGSPPA
ncbi:MAG TPA: NAD(P)/FAD-dependent oxidoreductase [Candidatus Methylomirabilis sp.]|nr:NAD(P)/FAD-dependent oxidoreductase [Candidatus Methylomirabilis sp.]